MSATSRISSQRRGVPRLCSCMAWSTNHTPAGIASLWSNPQAARKGTEQVQPSCSGNSVPEAAARLLGAVVARDAGPLREPVQVGQRHAGDYLISTWIPRSARAPVTRPSSWSAVSPRRAWRASWACRVTPFGGTSRAPRRVYARRCRGSARLSSGSRRRGCTRCSSLRVSPSRTASCARTRDRRRVERASLAPVRVLRSRTAQVCAEQQEKRGRAVTRLRRRPRAGDEARKACLPFHNRASTRPIL